MLPAEAQIGPRYRRDGDDPAAADAEGYPEELPVLAELLPHTTTPVTMVQSRHDRVVPPANAEFWPRTQVPKNVGR